MKFIEKIIQARKAKALTQEDLAEAVGVSRQAVSKWETGEANPDLDKLISICKVLDLSMDYLCLDKQPEITVELPQPQKPKMARYLIAGICIGLVAAILVGMLAMGLQGKNNERTEPETTTLSTTTAAPDYTDMLSSLQVADAKLEERYGTSWRVTFVPSIQIPNMQVQIAVRNNKIGTTYCYDATRNESGYYIEFDWSDYEYDYDFLAVCTVGGIEIRLPLIHVEGMGTDYTYEDISTK